MKEQKINELLDKIAILSGDVVHIENKLEEKKNELGYLQQELFSLQRYPVTSPPDDIELGDIGNGYCNILFRGKNRIVAHPDGFEFRAAQDNREFKITNKNYYFEEIFLKDARTLGAIVLVSSEQISASNLSKDVLCRYCIFSESGRIYYISDDDMNELKWRWLKSEDKFFYRISKK